jgi:hypothetical protein
MRSSVDLPEPERPSSPTISPSRTSRSMFTSTGNGVPEGFANDMQTLLCHRDAELDALFKALTIRVTTRAAFVDENIARALQTKPIDHAMQRAQSHAASTNGRRVGRLRN